MAIATHKFSNTTELSFFSSVLGSLLFDFKSFPTSFSISCIFSSSSTLTTLDVSIASVITASPSSTTSPIFFEPLTLVTFPLDLLVLGDFAVFVLEFLVVFSDSFSPDTFAPAVFVPVFFTLIFSKLLAFFNSLFMLFSSSFFKASLFVFLPVAVFFAAVVVFLAVVCFFVASLSEVLDVVFLVVVFLVSVVFLLTFLTFSFFFSSSFFTCAILSLLNISDTL